jgi:hypothetical protein
MANLSPDHLSARRSSSLGDFVGLWSSKKQKLDGFAENENDTVKQDS